MISKTGNSSGLSPLPMDLFAEEKRDIPLGDGAIVLGGFACPYETKILSALENVIALAPLRHMTTPAGYRMSVAMTSCGQFGWVAERTGYRYDAHDPESGKPWPSMPEVFMALAQSAAKKAGYNVFRPTACLINRYEPSAKLSLHQDKDELDLTVPIVSVSLGLPAIFLFGGVKRSDSIRKIPLVNGDIVVWGGASRLAYHGILPLRPGSHPLLGNQRINLTFRKTN
ncbi:MAG: DNA oxidative demethylase AlkB [Nitrosomonas ureae]